MTDRWAVALAMATATGALVSKPFPLAIALAGVALAFLVRRPPLLCIAAAALASCLGARAWDGLEPRRPEPIDHVVTLVSDPVDSFGALRVDIRHGGRRLEAWAHGRAAGDLRPRLAGERLHVAGRVTPVPPRVRRRLAVRHVSGRVTVRTVGEPTDAGDAPSRIANGLRRTLVNGARSLPDDTRALFTGFVLGDDRHQSPLDVADFRAAGLTHLMAVSGQNVAFVLAVAWPALRLLSLRGRLVAGLAVLALFGVLTRWEPSVLRAEAMAAIALTAMALGRAASPIRMLALAVAGLILVDPLLVHSVGFRLSVGACAGIALLAVPLARRMPLPLAVTIAAQAGVAPLLISTFGGVPLASLPANLLAVPAAGPVMVWGMTAGLVAGIVPARLATLIHVPTRLLVGWIAGVARWTADLPLPTVDARQLALLTALGVLVVLLGRMRAVPALALAAVVFWPPPATLANRQVGGGPRLWRAGGATVLVADAPATTAAALTTDLRALRVRRLDVVVLERGSRAAKSLDVVLTRYRPRLVLSRPGTRASVGPLEVIVRTIDPVTATVRRRARAPPERRRPRAARRRRQRARPRARG